jgi:amino acid transporter
MCLLQATATNIISMVGVGPFLTIPFMVAAMNGPHVIYAWIAGLVLALADGLVYAQLGAALPGSGGGYLYMREAFKPFGLGGLMGFRFIFDTLLVAPLSVAGGAVGVSDYLQYFWISMTPLQHNLLAAAICVVCTALLWRNIESIGRLAVIMLAGVVEWLDRLLGVLRQQHFDLLLRGAQRRLALARQGHAALESLERLFERNVALLEFLDEGFELAE